MNQFFIGKLSQTKMTNMRGILYHEERIYDLDTFFKSMRGLFSFNLSLLSATIAIMLYTRLASGYKSLVFSKKLKILVIINTFIIMNFS